MLNYIDLFAGAGGLSEGFVRQGFNAIAHVEIDEAACYTLKTRVAYHHLKSAKQLDIYEGYLRGDIKRAELYAHVPKHLLDSIINLPIGEEYNQTIHAKILALNHSKEIDLIIGGPPCQAYSLVGRARSENQMKGDPRNYLYVQYAKYLEKYNPKMFVFENVLGLKSAGKGVYLKNMEKLFQKKGYSMQLFEIEADNFNVLQKRKRVIIIGWRNDFVPTIPNLSAIRNPHDFTVANLFTDLPVIQAGKGINKNGEYNGSANNYLTDNAIRNGFKVLTQHVARPHTEQDKKIYTIAVDKWEKGERLDYNDLPENLKTHSNRTSFIDRFKVVAADKPYSHTVVAHIAKDGHYYIHPDKKQNRSITVREAARLQSFPDNYYFEGVKEDKNRTSAFKQIGNAVPPLMANAIAKKISEML